MSMFLWLLGVSSISAQFAASWSKIKHLSIILNTIHLILLERQEDKNNDLRQLRWGFFTGLLGPTTSHAYWEPSRFTTVLAWLLYNFTVRTWTIFVTVETCRRTERVKLLNLVTQANFYLVLHCCLSFWSKQWVKDFNLEYSACGQRKHVPRLVDPFTLWNPLSLIITDELSAVARPWTCPSSLSFSSRSLRVHFY